MEEDKNAGEPTSGPTEDEIHLAEAHTAQAKAETEKNDSETRKIREAQKAEKAERRRDRMDGVFGFFKSLSRKKKIGSLICTVLVAAAAICGISYFTSPRTIETLAESDLVNVVNIESLSTLQYPYHGIAEQKSKTWFGEKTAYRVKYEVTITANYQMSAIRFTKDEESKTVTAYLPAAEFTISAPKNMSYMNVSANPNVEEVITLCKEDASNDVELDPVREVADESLRDTVSALTKPLIEKYGYSNEIVWKSLAEYPETEASNEAQ